jgi:hypothetical protein
VHALSHTSQRPRSCPGGNRSQMERCSVMSAARRIAFASIFAASYDLQPALRFVCDHPEMPRTRTPPEGGVLVVACVRRKKKRPA